MLKMKLSDKEKTREIIEALKSRHESLIWVEELAFSSGARRCDFWTLHPHRSKGYHATAFEVKVSRADFKRDNWAKQRDVRLFSDEFYYVTPTGLINLEELPDWAGLWEYDLENKKWSCPIEAPRRDKDAPSWELIVSILRYGGEVKRDTDIIRLENKELKRQIKSYKYTIEELYRRESEKFNAKNC